MPITLRPEAAAEMIRRALSGYDHRDIVVDMIDAMFVSEVIACFKQVVDAKMSGSEITLEWYRRHFLDLNLSSRDLAFNAGLNMKTIKNKRGSEKRSIVIEESLEHFDKLVELIRALIDDDLNIDLALTFRGVTVHLDLNESLVVINALAVQRAAIRGGAWSTSGKQVESPIMETLCRLFQVNPAHYARRITTRNVSRREVDYYLIPPVGNEAKCEVKLMGIGNPEGADGPIARDSRVFIVSTLSDARKEELDDRGVLWTELQTPRGFLRFRETLEQLHIPHTALPPKADYSEDIERAIRETFG